MSDSQGSDHCFLNSEREHPEWTPPKVVGNAGRWWPSAPQKSLDICGMSGEWKEYYEK